MVGDGADNIAVYVGDFAVIVDKVVLVGVEHPGCIVEHLVFAIWSGLGGVRNIFWVYGRDIGGHDVEFAQLDHVHNRFAGQVDDGGPGVVERAYGVPFGIGDDSGVVIDKQVAQVAAVVHVRIAV